MRRRGRLRDAGAKLRESWARLGRAIRRTVWAVGTLLWALLLPVRGVVKALWALAKGAWVVAKPVRVVVRVVAVYLVWPILRLVGRLLYGVARLLGLVAVARWTAGRARRLAIIAGELGARIRRRAAPLAPLAPVSLLVAVGWALVSFLTPADAGPPPDAPVMAAVYAPPVETIETHVLARGTTLGHVLARARIRGNSLADLLLALREYKNPRDLREGVEVTVRRWREDGSPRAIEVRLNADSTIWLAANPLGWKGDVRVTPTMVDTVYVEGTIQEGRTLYEAIVKDEGLSIPPAERAALVLELAEIYAYQLDFTHDIQPGDHYRVVYEREARPDGTARERRVLVAEMENRGEIFPAIYFNPRGDGGGYYDPEGRSLRRAFRRYPLQYIRITSSFAWRRYHPVLGIYRAHLGTDFGAAQGTPVLATGDGTVRSAGWNGGYGNVIVLRHPGGYTSRYAHLRGFARGIRPGRPVSQGQVIGYVGSTGLATGPHLHYELRKHDRPLDVRKVKLPGAPPIPKELRDEYAIVREQRVALLERLGPDSGPRFAKASPADTVGTRGDT